MNKRQHRSLGSDLPKGAFRMPTGEIAQQVVWTDKRGRRISISGVQREKPDLELLAKVLVEMARKQLAAEEEREAGAAGQAA